MDRIKLKERARDFLSGGRYLKSLFYTLFISLLSYNFLMVNFDQDLSNVKYYIGLGGITAFKEIGLETFWKLSFLRLFVVVFILPMFAVSLYRYYMRDYSDMEKFNSEKFLSVGPENYGNIIKIFLIRGLKIFLWSLLLFIPAIIKSYEYFAIPYILAENPELESKEVFALTKEIMEGNKLEVFKLRISFIGWIIVGALLPGAIFLINPYMEATYTQAYMDIKNSKGIKIGKDTL